MQGLLHAGVEEAVGVAPGGFGFVHGQVGAFEQLVHALAFLAKEGQADAGGAVVLLACQLERGVEGQEQFAGVLATGVGSIAVVRALVNAPDPKTAAVQLLQAMQSL